MPEKKTQIVIITTGQPSTNPRMMKEFTALKAQGYSVRVLYSYWAGWAKKNDEEIINAYPDCFKEVGGNPISNKRQYFFSRLLYRFFNYRELKLGWPSDFVLARASFFLQKEAGRCRADIYIAHNLGALPAAVYAAGKFAAKVGFDAEDYHRGESDIGSISSSRAVRIEDKYFRQLDYLTMSSPLIATAYQKLYPDIDNIQVLRNVFPSSQQPSFKDISRRRLKMIWFSQSVGLNRGLQDIFNALNLVIDVSVELTIIGQDLANNKAHLLQLLVDTEHIVRFEEPLPEADLLNECSRHHIGLALEPGFSENNKIALSNKIFSYLLAGNYVIASNTPAQEQFFNQNPSLGEVYAIGDVQRLAAIIKVNAENLEKLDKNRKGNYDITRQQFSWDQEKGKFLNIVSSLLPEER